MHPRSAPGQTVRISFDALPKQSFPGKVKRVAPYVSAVEKQARTVDIEATLDADKAPPRLLVGYSADVEVVLAVRDNGGACANFGPAGRRRVLVAGADGKLQERAGQNRPGQLGVHRGDAKAWLLATAWSHRWSARA
jgi:HlyD family secretion protein